MSNMDMLNKLLMEQCTDAHFEALLEVFDRLHEAAAVGNLDSVTPLDPREVLGWLDDIMFTIEETAREVEKTLNTNDMPMRNWSDN